MKSFKGDFVFKYAAFFLVCLFVPREKNNDERVCDFNKPLLWLIEGYH